MYDPQLDTFIQAAEAGSFAKAAERMYVTTVSVMNQVNALEERFGVKLFTRTNRGVELTEAGRFLYGEAKRMISESEAALARAREIAGVERRAVRVGASLLRPCRPLTELWNEAGADAAFQIEIAPFDDCPAGMAQMLASLGRGIDCFVSPCDSVRWARNHRVVPLWSVRCCVAAARTHRLAGKSMLSWEDMEGERLMLIKRGESRVLDAMRREIEAEHPGITIADIPNTYDMEVFNECERGGCLMEIPEPWAGVHPSLVTIPVEWNYELPFGVVCSKKPSAAFSSFLQIIEKQAKRRRGGKV